jgi:Flp pilus assembly protein TadB
LLRENLETITQQRDSGPSSTTAAVLESQLAEEKAERKKERFFLLSAISALIWVLISIALNNSWLSTLLFVVLLVWLIGLANWLEVPWVVRHYEECLAWMTRKSNKNFEQETE